MEELKYQKSSNLECAEKRNFRVHKAIEFKSGNTVEDAISTTIFKDNDIELVFKKPGKDNGKEKKGRLLRDMTPIIYADNNPIVDGTFKEMWKHIYNLQQVLDDESRIMLYRLIYKMAYMIDFELDDKNDNYIPNTVFKEDVKKIQSVLDYKKYGFNLKAFLGFLDILGWNEDYRYKNDNDRDQGRINCLLTMISVPIELKKLCNRILELKENELFDFDNLIDMCYTFSISGGLYVLSKTELIEELKLTD